MSVITGPFKEKIKLKLLLNMAKNSSSCGAAHLMCHHLLLMTMMSFHRQKMRAIATSAPLSDADIAGLNIPTGIPLLYTLNADLTPTVKGGEYLDPEAAKEAITAVANQGKK